MHCIVSLFLFWLLTTSCLKKVEMGHENVSSKRRSPLHKFLQRQRAELSTSHFEVGAVDGINSKLFLCPDQPFSHIDFGPLLWVYMQKKKMNGHITQGTNNYSLYMKQYCQIRKVRTPKANREHISNHSTHEHSRMTHKCVPTVGAEVPVPQPHTGKQAGS